MVDITSLFVGVFSLLPLLVLKFSGRFIYFAMFAWVAIAVHGIYFYGPNVLYILVLTYVISTIAELVSLKTPIYCFGVKYRYNLKNPFFSSNIHLLGVYPLEVTFAWVILKYISFNLAMIMASAFGFPIWVSVLFIPFILVSLDFVIDPVAVNVEKLWSWEKGSWYFGIPLRNFFGWYLVGLTASLPLLWIEAGKPLTFNYLLIFPILFYAFMLGRVRNLLKLDVSLGIIGTTPAVLWVLLSTIGLYILYIRQG